MADLPDWYTQTETELDLPYLPLTGGTMTGAIAMGSSKITGLGAPAVDADAATKKYADDQDHAVVQANVTASRAIDGTVYQNTSGKIIMVAVSMYLNGGDGAGGGSAYVGAANPPTSIVAGWLDYASASFGVKGTLTFIVPPSYYYKIGTVGSPTLGTWTEWSMH
ncbi:MAG: hypothetical protein HYX96_06145 [Chloroflexi bacterium]|nr:hypothetical protein [Chloroflexota bacterium]